MHVILNQIFKFAIICKNVAFVANGKCAWLKSRGHFCSRRKAAKFCHPVPFIEVNYPLTYWLLGAWRCFTKLEWYEQYLLSGVFWSVVVVGRIWKHASGMSHKYLDYSDSSLSKVLASSIDNFLSLPLGIRPNLSCAGIVPEFLSLWGVTIPAINVLSSYYECLWNIVKMIGWPKSTRRVVFAPRAIADHRCKTIMICPFCFSVVYRCEKSIFRMDKLVSGGLSSWLQQGLFWKDIHCFLLMSSLYVVISFIWRALFWPYDTILNS